VTTASRVATNRCIRCTRCLALACDAAHCVHARRKCVKRAGLRTSVSLPDESCTSRETHVVTFNVRVSTLPFIRRAAAYDKFHFIFAHRCAKARYVDVQAAGLDERFARTLNISRIKGTRIFPCVYLPVCLPVCPSVCDGETKGEKEKRALKVFFLLPFLSSLFLFFFFFFDVPMTSCTPTYRRAVSFLSHGKFDQFDIFISLPR